MGMVCQACNSSKRIQIDRDIVQGKSYSGIARTYGLGIESVRLHAKNHLSKQLVRAWDTKELDESMDLMGRIDKMLSRAEKIFKRNYVAKKDNTALKALGEQRKVFELLSNISFQLHQARISELELMRREDGSHDRQEAEQLFQNVSEVLTDHELMLFSKLLEKIEAKDPAIDVVAEYLPDPVSLSMQHIEQQYMKAGTLEEQARIPAQLIPFKLIPGVHRPHWSGLDGLPEQQTIDQDKPEPAKPALKKAGPKKTSTAKPLFTRTKKAKGIKGPDKASNQ